MVWCFIRVCNTQGIVERIVKERGEPGICKEQCGGHRNFGRGAEYRSREIMRIDNLWKDIPFDAQDKLLQSHGWNPVLCRPSMETISVKSRALTYFLSEYSTCQEMFDDHRRFGRAGSLSQLACYDLMKVCQYARYGYLYQSQPFLEVQYIRHNASSLNPFNHPASCNSSSMDS